MTTDELREWLAVRNIGEVSCLLPDFGGTARGKSMTPALFLEACEGRSLRMPEGTYAINAQGEFVKNKHIDESEKDMVLVCDLDTITLEPWTSEAAACVICDGYRPDGQSSQLSPRQILKNVIALFRERGLRPIVGPEVEFYLISKFEGGILEPSPPKGVSGLAEFGQYAYSLDAIDEFDGFFEDLYDYCEIQSIPVDTLIHEDGPCQFEINLAHGDALKVADQLFMFKRLARHVAKRHGLFVTFMAKPYAEESGSSIHLHQSVVDLNTGQNVFANADGSDSDLFSHYIGGLQTYLPAAMPFIAPYTNSFNRFEAYMSAPTNVHWGRENRTVGLRVPDAGPAARRVENRVAGADANPYLSIAASLVCGLIGIDEKLPRKEEFIGQSADDQSRALPGTLMEAIGEFEASSKLRTYLGDPIIDTFADVKRSEFEHRSSILSPWDVRYLMVNV